MTTWTQLIQSIGIVCVTAWLISAISLIIILLMPGSIAPAPEDGSNPETNYPDPSYHWSDR